MLRDVIQVAFFVGVFAGASLVALRPRARTLRDAYTIAFFVAVTVSGLTYLPAMWPFGSWALYNTPQGEVGTHYEWHVWHDGGALRYDPRAIPLSGATPLERFGRDVAADPQNQVSRELACFLLHSATRYVENRQQGRLSWPKFPPHQFGIRWTDADIAASADGFQRIELVEVELRATPDGSEARKTATTVKTFACS